MPDPKAKNDLLQFSQAGVQMVVIIGAFVFLGYKLDQKYPSGQKWFTLGFSLFGVVIAMVWFLRAFNKITRKHK
jgi:hypothetical protein